jgi:hypothetical protein
VSTVGMNLALQIGLGIVIGVLGCWFVATFFTAAVVSALPHQTVDVRNMLRESGPISLSPRQISVPVSQPVVVARELTEVDRQSVTVLTRPEYRCVRDRTQVPVSISCVNVGKDAR